MAKRIDSYLALIVDFDLFSTYIKPESNTSYDTKSFNIKNMISTTADDIEVEFPMAKILPTY